MNKNCIKCQKLCKITEAYPVWSVLDIKEPDLLCYNCKPEKLAVKFAKKTDNNFIKNVSIYSEKT